MIDHWTKRWSERHQNVAFAGTGGDYARIRQACKTLKWDESLIAKTFDAYLDENEPFYGMHPTTLLIARLSTFAAKAQGAQHGRKRIDRGEYPEPERDINRLFARPGPVDGQIPENGGTQPAGTSRA
jgi:hypothetical protein